MTDKRVKVTDRKVEEADKRVKATDRKTEEADRKAEEAYRRAKAPERLWKFYIVPYFNIGSRPTLFYKKRNFKSETF